MPYNPQTEYRGDQYVFQGGRQTAEALTGWLQNFLNQEKQVNQMGKSADYFVKSNQNADGTNPVLKEMDIHPEAWANLGARDKAAAVQGLVQSRAAKQQAAAAQAQTDLRNAEAAKAQTDTEAEGAMGGIFNRANALMTPTQLPMGTPDWSAFLNGQGPVQTPGPTATQGMSLPRALMQAIGESRSMNPKVQGAIVNKLLPLLMQNATGGDEGGVKYSEDPVTGKRQATYGKIMMDSGINPSMAQQAMSGGAVPLTNPDGDVIGYNVPIGGGKFRPMATKDLTAYQKQNLILQHQKAKGDSLARLLITPPDKTNIVNQINDEIGMHEEAIAQLRDKSVSAAQTASDPANKPPVTPVTPKDRVKGTVYRTPKGPLQWTGTGWIKTE